MSIFIQIINLVAKAILRMHHVDKVDEAIVKAMEILNNHEAKITVIPDGISVIVN